MRRKGNIILYKSTVQYFDKKTYVTKLSSTKCFLLILFLVTLMFFNLFSKYLNSLQKIIISDRQKTLALVKQISQQILTFDHPQIPTKAQKQQVTFLENFFILSHNDHNNILTKISIQLVLENVKNTNSLNIIKDQKPYIKDLIAVVLSDMTYKQVSQIKQKYILKENIKEALNHFLFHGSVKNIDVKSVDTL